MRSQEAFRLLKEGILKKGTKVKMRIKDFQEFTEIDDAFIRTARTGEIEDDWVVIVINGKMYDALWIYEIEE